MSAAISRHDALVAAAVEARGGRLLKTKGEGDSTFSVFSWARDAVAAALALQQAVGSESWTESTPIQVRVAIHTGEAELRAGDYFGATVNRTARLRAIAHGGQTLLSQASEELVNEALPEQVTLRDLGDHRLKDLARAERVFQLCHPDLRTGFPPLRSLNPRVTNLPVQLTSFVGREGEIAEIERLLGTTRLATLTGAGGVGKTRLALQVGADAVDQFQDGAMLVELAALSDPGLVPQVLAMTLGVPERPPRPVIDTITDYLRGKHFLLLLDNCEHLVDACAHLVDGLLRSCPDLRIIVTSREPLSVPGEATFRIPSLPAPDSERPAAEEAGRFEAVRLFVDRAALARPGFALGDENAYAVAHICQRLDGIPLAIELAAATVRSLTTEQIVERLDDRFQLLTGGARTVLPRQQTLRATLDWSYELLPSDEKQLLRRLGVFIGGFTLEAAEVVCCSAPLELGRMPGLLARLVDRSLVVVHEEDQPRYSLLETIRHYSEEKLLDSGEEATVRGKHRDWCLALAEEAEPELRGHDQIEWLDRLETEQDNLRAALDWCTTEKAEVEAGLRLAVAFNRFWTMRGDRREGRAILERLLANADEERTILRARALLVSATLTFAVFDDEASIPLFTSALVLARDLNHDWTIARSLALMSLAKVRSGACDATEAKALTLEGLAVARGTDDDWLIGLSLQHVAAVSGWEVNEGSTERTTYLEEALERHRRSGDRWYIAADLSSLGEEARLSGDYEKAGYLYEEALAQLQPMGQKLDGISNLINLGYVRLQMGQVEEARAHFSESLVSSRELGVETAFGIPGIAGIGAVAAAEGDSIRSAHLLGAAEALTNSAGRPRDPVDQVEFDRAAGLARAQLGDEAFATAWTEGMRMTLDEAISLAFGP